MPHFLCSMLNETLAFDSDAEYMPTGTETRPKEIVAVPMVSEAYSDQHAGKVCVLE